MKNQFFPEKRQRKYGKTAINHCKI